MFKLVILASVATLAFGDVSHLFNKPATHFQTPFPQQYSRPVVQPVVVKQVNYGGNQAHVGILRQNQDQHPDGSYTWAFETENGIQAHEQGAATGGSHGSYSYTSPEGQVVSINYVADENGYHAEGSHIPTPPPVPAAIAKALAYIAAHPQRQEEVFIGGRKQQPYYG